MTDYRIYARDKDRNKVAEIDDYSNLEMVLRYNDVSTWILDVPAGGSASNLLTASPVTGIIVERDGVTLLSGPVRRLERVWSENDDTVAISGVDDTWSLASRLVVPAAIATNYYQDHDVRTGAAETVLKGYVTANLTSSAGAARQVPGVTVQADFVRGITVTARGRFGTVLEILQEVATLAGLGFKVIQSGTNLEFQVYVPVDRRLTARFGSDFGNLSAYEYRQVSPDADYVYVAGQGEGAARVIVERQVSSTVALYGRIEAFRDARDVPTTAELEQRGDQDLAERAATSELRITPIDTDLVAYGRDYTLGDTVTLIVDDANVVDVVREVVIRLTADRGEDLRWNGQVTELPQQITARRLKSRLSLIERA